MENPPIRMCATTVEIKLKYLGLWDSHQGVVDTRTSMCENYSVSRKFYSRRPKEDRDIGVAGIVEKA